MTEQKTRTYRIEAALLQDMYTALGGCQPTPGSNITNAKVHGILSLMEKAIDEQNRAYDAANGRKPSLVPGVENG